MLAENSLLGKVELILDALAVDGGRVGLSTLAKASGVPKSSVHRICIDLIEWGVVERSGDGFRLGPRLFELGSRVPSRRRLRDTALPYLEDLLVATGHTVHLAVPANGGVFYVDKLVVHASTPTPFAVASQVPLHATATGKVMLAFGDAEVTEQALAGPLQAVTEQTITDAWLLSTSLELIRANGFGLECGELVAGYSSIAAPILGYGEQLIGAVSVTSASEGFRVEQIADAVRTTARAVSRRLGSRVDVESASSAA